MFDGQEFMTLLIGGCGTIFASVSTAIKFAAKKVDEYRKQAYDDREKDRQERIEREERFMTQLKEMEVVHVKLLETNKELASSNRMLINDYKMHMNNIENLLIHKKYEDMYKEDK